MNKSKVIILWAAALGTVLFCAPAFADEGCKNSEQQKEVMGTLVDTRDYEATSWQLSQSDAALFDRAAEFGPFYALIGVSGDPLRPVYPDGSFFREDKDASIADLDDNAKEKIAPFLGQRVALTGCVSDSPAWPSISSVSGIEAKDQ